MALSIAADVGGTFTDFVVLEKPAGDVSIFKVPSTSPDPSEGLLKGLAIVVEHFGVGYDEIEQFTHGSTIATNCLIVMNGAVCGLLTTRGFRDLLELARQRRPKLYDLYADKPVPLIPRSLREEITERIAFDGSVITPLSAADVKGAVDRLTARGVEAIVIAYLHSYANPAHEVATKRLVTQAAPGLNVYASHEVLAEFREFERLSTAVVNAYVGPVVKRYLVNLRNQLRRNGFRGALLVLKADGGIVSPEEAERAAVWTIGSGPSAGVQGAMLVARQSMDTPGVKLITLDMGGTSTDISLVLDGRAVMTAQREVAGWPVRGAAVNVQSIGAGGGSIAWVDDGGLLRVGPLSAGGTPGPACYDNGGSRPTVTDAHVVLGRLQTLLGGKMRLRHDLARQAVAEHIAIPLGLSIEKAAIGILAVANANMCQAVRLMTIEQGYDPREFVLVPYGGAGPLHAPTIAQAFGIRRVLVPACPGALSALGVLVSEISKEFSATRVMPLDSTRVPATQELFEGLARQASDWLAREKLEYAEHRMRRSVDLRCKGQSYELNVPFPDFLAATSLAELTDEFHRLHEQSYGFAFTASDLECVTFRLRLEVLRKTTPAFPTPSPAGRAAPEVRHRSVWFDDGDAFVDVPILSKTELGADPIHGPAIIEQLDATTILFPSQWAEQDRWGNLHLHWAEDSGQG